MTYNQNCMNKLMIAIFEGLNFKDDDYDNNNLYYQITLKRAIENRDEFKNYSPNEIKTCFYILIKRNLIEADNNQGHSPYTVKDFTSEGYKELVNILISDNPTKH